MTRNRGRLLVFVFALSAPLFAYAQSPELPADQQINDFSLAGYGDKGKKTWDVSGKSADIFNDTVKLDNVVGNLYGEAEDIRLSADTGDYDKASNVIRLEKNVVISTTSGARLTTDTLQWDRAQQLVSTPDQVTIVRDSMLAVAQGAHGEPSLKKVALEKDVRVLILPATPGEKGIKEKIVITCDGPFDIDYGKNVAVLRNNVIVEREESTIYSDLMDVYFSSGSGAGEPEEPEEKPASGMESAFAGKSISKIIARNNVKVVRGENVSYSDEAEYSAADSRIVLRGRPKIVVTPSQNFSAHERAPSNPFGSGAAHERAPDVPVRPGDAYDGLGETKTDAASSGDEGAR